MHTCTTNGPAACALALNDAGEALTEAYAGGPWNGISITNGYDSLLRRTKLATLNASTLLTLVTNSYDAAGRVSVVSDGTNWAAYSYLANAALVDHIVFASNGVARMTTSNRYDNLNRRTAVANANGSGVNLDSHGYAYNAANQRTSLTNADGSYWVYQYDGLGQVTSGVKHWSDGSVVAGQQFGYTFDTIGNRTQTAAGGDQYGANLRYASYTANNLNQYSSRTVPGYADIIGSATNAATVSVNNTAVYRRSNYFRVQLALPNGSGPVYQSVTNLAVLNQGGNPDIVATNIGNEFLPQTPESYAYDADGNLTNDGRWSYYWDAENRLVNMTSLSGAPTASKLKLDFTYDYKGRRAQKLVSTNNGSSYIAQYTNRFVYDGWNQVATLSPASTLLASMMWGSDLSGTAQGAGGVGGLLAENIVGNGAQFAAYDANGNIAALVSATNGTVTASYEYGPFGELIRSTGPMAKLNPKRFQTVTTDDETDMLYYGYRYYNPSTGRWLNRDPLDELGFNTEFDTSQWGNLDVGVNLYSFVKNDPIDAYDINGLLDSGQCVIATEAAVTVAAGVAALPAEAVVLGVVIVGEGVVITYELCTKPKCPCPACKPPVGTIGYRLDKVPPSKPHKPFPGDHVHLYRRQQNPNNCQCFWQPIGVTAPPPPPGAVPITP